MAQFLGMYHQWRIEGGGALGHPYLMGHPYLRYHLYLILTPYVVHSGIANFYKGGGAISPEAECPNFKGGGAISPECPNFT